MKKNLASIVIVTCNRLDFTRQTIESVLHHTTYPDYEVIVLDNGSSDGTPDYLRSIQSHSSISSITYFKHNLGKGKAANVGFQISQGEFIIGLDDDVIVPQNWLKKMIDALRTVPGVGWLCMNFDNIPEGFFRHEYERTFGSVRIQVPPIVGGQCVAMPRTTYEKLGGYIESSFYGGIDGEYNARARRSGLATGYVIDVVGHHLGGTLKEVELYPDYYKYKIDAQHHLQCGNDDLARLNFFDHRKIITLLTTPDSLRKGELFKTAQSPAVYFVFMGYKHEIPSREVFARLRFDWNQVKIIPQNELEKIPTGIPLLL